MNVKMAKKRATQHWNRYKTDSQRKLIIHSNKWSHFTHVNGRRDFPQFLLSPVFLDWPSNFLSIGVQCSMPLKLTIPRLSLSIRSMRLILIILVYKEITGNPTYWRPFPDEQHKDVLKFLWIWHCKNEKFLFNCRWSTPYVTYKS